jgi:hypothetical protein
MSERLGGSSGRSMSDRLFRCVSEAAKFSLERGHKDRSLMFDTVHAVL